jgi:hypothetical protein
MSDYSGEEKRKFPRIEAHYMLKCRQLEQAGGFDVTSTRNISQGGATITTSCQFEEGNLLELTFKFPFATESVPVKAQVLDCRTIIKGSVWELRIKFVDMPEDYGNKINEFIGKRTHNE